MKFSVGQIWEATIPVRREIISIDSDIISFSVDGEQEDEPKQEFLKWIIRNNAEKILSESDSEYSCEECEKVISKEMYDMYDGCCKNCYDEFNTF